MERPPDGTFIDGLPESQYHKKEHGFSSSNMKSILKTSLKHFKYELDQPPKPPTDAMKLGTIFHTKVLTPEVFDKEIVTLPAFNLRTKNGRLDKHEFETKNHDKLVVTEQQMEIGIGMAESVLECEEAMALFDGTINERSMYGSALGVPLRARADSCSSSKLLELKSARDGSPEGFTKAIANLKYHVSLVHYSELMEQCMPEVESAVQLEYYFIVAESHPPFAVAVYKASEQMIAIGWHEWKEALGKLSEALAADEWPGYTMRDVTPEIDLPRWAIPEDFGE